MWILKDFFINTYVSFRLWYLIKFKPEKFDCIINEKNKNGWNITFSDEFDEGKVDKDKWRTDSYFGLRYHPGNIINNNESPKEYLSDNCFEFTSTTIKQLVKKEPIEINHIDFDGKDWGKWVIPYQTGSLDSSKSFMQKYGYFEIRSKITSEPGSWPAFWLVSTSNWPPEIDVYEIYTGKKNGNKMFNSNFHYGDEDKGTHNSIVKSHKVKDVSEGFHLYAVEWNNKIFKIYYDNILIRVYSNPKVLNEFKYPMHIIINAAVDDGYGRGLNESNFPTYHEIDYVRAYEKIK